MIRFNSDYLEGAHPVIMAHLLETNLEQTPGYGEDAHCENARAVIRRLCAAPDADVHFLVGGTQTNFTFLAAVLKPWQGVISADTGHIAVHETGAVEATGHKVIALPNINGKLDATMVDACCRLHFADESHEHMVMPGAVYISNPTEVGTLYTREELTALREVCDRWGLTLFLDGARLGYGLASPENTLDLPFIARVTDAFYIGGTKQGLLFGEALVITREDLQPDFRYIIKQKGGMLAKGRLLGVQFEAALEDGLYMELSRHKNYRAQLVGVLGDPVDGNPTGVMEEAGFEHAGLNWRYITVKVLPGDLDAAMAGVKAFNMRGVNLTMPHKINVLKHMDALSEAAKVIGAVNTVVCREDGTLFGENTDGKGFVQSLTDAGIPLAARTVTLLGAGGAARSIGVECALAGARGIDRHQPQRGAGRALADIINAHTAAEAEYLPWEGHGRVPEGTDILINATCVGLHPDGDACPDIDFDGVRPGMVVCDVVFNPVDTVFLKRAAERGAKCVDGLGMLVNQGCINYTLWTGEKAPKEVMYEALKREFVGQ